MGEPEFALLPIGDAPPSSAREPLAPNGATSFKAPARARDSCAHLHHRNTPPPMPPHFAHRLLINAQSISEPVCLQLVDGSLPCIEGLVKDGAKPWSALRSGKPQGTSSVDQWTLFMSSRTFQVLLLAFSWMERLRPNFSATRELGPLVHWST